MLIDKGGERVQSYKNSAKNALDATLEENLMGNMAHVTSPAKRSQNRAEKCSKSSELTALFGMYQERPAAPFACAGVSAAKTQPFRVTIDTSKHPKAAQKRPDIERSTPA